MDPTKQNSIRESITVGQAIDFLNQLLHIDRNAINLLFLGHRVECNEELAKHQSVQVFKDENQNPIKYEVGILGIINGFFGADQEGTGQIAALFSQEQGIIAFSRLDVKDATDGTEQRSTDGPADSQG